MAIAAASRSLVAFSVARPGASAYGPAEFTLMRRANGGMRTRKVTDKVGGVLRRGAAAVVQLSQQCAGAYAFELSPGWIDGLLAAALCNDWAGDDLIDGDVETDLTFKESAAAGTSYVHRSFSGCRIAGIELDFPARAIAHGTIDVVGSAESAEDAWPVPFAPAASTPTDAIWTTPTITALSVLDFDPTPPIRRMSLSIRTEAEMGNGVTSLYGQSRGVGVRSVAGSLEAYFSSRALYQAMLDHQAGRISFKIGDGSGRYLFEIPNAQLGDGALVLGGKDEDLIASIPFEAVAAVGEPLIKIRRRTR